VVGLPTVKQQRHIVMLLENGGIRFRVQGFITNLPRRFRRTDLVVCKAGGLAVSEVLAAGLPLAVCHHYPGQEEYNYHFLLNSGAAAVVDTGADIVRLAHDRNRLRRLTQSARRLCERNAAEDLAARALGHLQSARRHRVERR
jgi:UDP-N-acetylglucosamine:LPS N-acetylglucosamine transferase